MLRQETKNLFRGCTLGASARRRRAAGRKLIPYRSCACRAFQALMYLLSLPVDGGFGLLGSFAPMAIRQDFRRFSAGRRGLRGQGFAELAPLFLRVVFWAALTPIGTGRKVRKRYGSLSRLWNCKIALRILWVRMAALKICLWRLL